MYGGVAEEGRGAQRTKRRCMGHGRLILCSIVENAATTVRVKTPLHSADGGTAPCPSPGSAESGHHRYEDRKRWTAVTEKVPERAVRGYLFGTLYRSKHGPTTGCMPRWISRLTERSRCAFDITGIWLSRESPEQRGDGSSDRLPRLQQNQGRMIGVLLRSSQSSRSRRIQT